MKHFSLLFWGVFLAISAFSQPIVYVTPAGAGTKSGTSWANALSGVQLPNQVATADSGTQFWIAAGTYKPTTTTDRTVSFSIASGVSVYGGFAGTETDLGQRSISINETIFSGDIGIEGDNSDNSLRILLIEDNSGTIQIDGLTISDSHQNYLDGNNGACGLLIENNNSSAEGKVRILNSSFFNIYSQGWTAIGSAIRVICNNYRMPTIEILTCIFKDNQSYSGSSISASSYNGRIKMLITDSHFERNNGSSLSCFKCTLSLNGCNFYNNNSQGHAGFGGAITQRYGDCTIENCRFMYNNGIFGGAIDGSMSTSTYKNCIFSNNNALYGGAIYSISQITATVQTFLNCSFISNSSSSGGVFYNSLTEIEGPVSDSFIPPKNDTFLKNCIVWENNASDSPVFKPQAYHNGHNELNTIYSLIQESYPGTGNLNTNPLFVDPTNGNFRLQPNSPAINAGSPDLTDLLPADIAGNPRIQGSRVDMGAYEFIGCSICLPFTISRIH